jgi:hypothetical protein
MTPWRLFPSSADRRTAARSRLVQVPPRSPAGVGIEGRNRWARNHVIIDDYFIWDGGARAAHDYLPETKGTERIERIATARYGGVCYFSKRTN